MTALVVNQPRLWLASQAVAAAAVTAEADTDLWTWTDHGLAVGDAVELVTLVGGTGLSPGLFFVLTAPSSSTFTLSETPGGAIAAMSADATSGTTMRKVTLLDDDIVSAMIDRPAETVDVRTFGAPRATDAGGGMDSITLALLWSSALYDKLAALAGAMLDMTFYPDRDDADPVTATVSFDVAPFGRYQVGERVETTLVLGVEDGVDYDPS